MSLAETDLLSSHRQAHWRHNRRWTFGLMAVWFGATLALVFWPNAWEFEFWGWPFTFWMAAQGVLLLYWCIVATYSWVMARADKRWDLEEREGEA
ncbi:MAG: hypothetical protein RL357_99 [Pseudomonadota bacterium]|jgi:putative solute:sodium symporter small subunit